MSCKEKNQKPIADYQSSSFSKYEAANQVLIADSTLSQKVIFMGNSITEGWPHARPSFFEENIYICRGISGQTSSQMLLRFRADVIDLKPEVVVILAGINDIAQNTGYIPLKNISENIFTMAELAAYNNIKVILCSILPAVDFPWRPGLNPASKIITLNKMIEGYALKKNFKYVDFHTAMKDIDNGLKVPEYTTADDLVHPNAAGYAVMEALIQPIIRTTLSTGYK